MDSVTRTALLAIAASHRSLATALESLLADQPSINVEPIPSFQPLTPTPSRTPPAWDPETDDPLVKPKVAGTREEQDWCSLTYLGGVYAINRRYERGLNPTEIRRYAIKAGYQDGRAVTAWSKGAGPTYNDDDKQRWIKPEGVDFWVRGLASKLGVALPDDLAGPWMGGPMVDARR